MAKQFYKRTALKVYTYIIIITITIITHTYTEYFTIISLNKIWSNGRINRQCVVQRCAFVFCFNLYAYWLNGNFISMISNVSCYFFLQYERIACLRMCMFIGVGVHGFSCLYLLWSDLFFLVNIFYRFPRNKSVIKFDWCRWSRGQENNLL